MAGGTGYALYSDALLLTEVVTAILLFYLTPVWSTILARLFLG
jgi:drug/metabolite transporter (DMT)-like permease